MSLSKTLFNQLVADHGKNIKAWPQALQDLVDPKIEARSIAPPISGKVDKFLNTDFYYYWMEDVCGATPKHDRVESAKWAGWQYATTDDVRMCSESAIVGRDKAKKSKDGGAGFSDEIRSGDRRMMKLPMHLWRQQQKAQLLQAYQMAYPQPMGESGPMTAANLIPGFKSETLDDAEISQAQKKFTSKNSVRVKTHKEIENEKAAAAVAV